MKKLLGTLLFFVSGGLFAQEVESGVFTLYKEIAYKPTGFCDVGTSLVIDKAEIMGHVAFLSDFVEGRCRLYVNPDHRYYVLSAGQSDACNVVTYHGRRSAPEGVYELSITDRRTSICRSSEDKLSIAVSEKGPSGAMRKRYSYEP